MASNNSGHPSRSNKKKSALRMENEGYIAGQREMLERLRDNVYTHIATGDPISDISVARFLCLMQCIPPENREGGTMNPRSQGSDDISMADILSLVNLGSSVRLSINRPSERTSEGRCPVPRCKRNIRNLSFHAQRKHIHRCRKVEAEKSLGTKAIYCYFCFTWIKMSAWSGHCQWHLESCSLDCGSLVHCGLVLQPALCPFCLGDSTLMPETRWHFWSSSASVLAHVASTHVCQDVRWPRECPHPECSIVIRHKESLYVHLGDAHGLESPEYEQNRLEVPNSAVGLVQISPLEPFPDIIPETSGCVGDVKHGKQGEHHEATHRKAASHHEAIKFPIHTKSSLHRDQSLGNEEHTDKFLVKSSNAANKEWSERGYPQIRWDRLSNRIQELDSWLRTCLELHQVPIFRDRYEGEMQNNSRTTSSSKKEPNGRSKVGYYGPRGETQIFSILLNSMYEAVSAKSVADGLIRKDPTAYIMQVLVPAVAHKLTSEDMNESSERALQIMEEGQDLGNVLHSL